MLAALTMTALLLGACGGGAGEGDDDRLQVVATTSIAGGLVALVAGDDAEVVTLMPIGTDPHDFQPSSQQAASLRSADLVVAWGLGLEEGLEDVLEAAKADGVQVLELSAQLDPIEFEIDHDADHEHSDDEHSDDEQADDEHDHALDPHTWTDPVRMADAARLIGARLTEIAPDGDWQSRAEDVARDMMDVHDRVTEILAVVPDARRKLVTGHDSLGYFAQRYGFEVVGVVIPGGTTIASPSSAQIADLVHAVEDAGITVLFAESTSSPALLEAVAAEVGTVRVVELVEGSLAAEGEPGDTLAGMLIHNAELIAEALG